MYKKILNILLCIILIISTLTNTVYGASGGSNNGESGTGSLGLSFIKDPNDPKYGDLHYEALDTTATTSIRYVSVGWIIRTDYKCDDHGGNPKPLTAKCNPMSGTKDVDYIQLDLQKMIDDKTMTKIDKREGAKTRTIYEMEAKYIQDILKARDIFKDIKEGDPVFFSAYLNVTSGGKKKSGPH